MFARARGDSNLTELSAMLLSVSLAVGGCERKQNGATSNYQPPAHSTTFNPKTDEVASLPHAEHGKIIEYESFEKLEISTLSLQLMCYNANLGDRIADALNDLVTLDKAPGGVDKSGRKEEFSNRLTELLHEANMVEKSAPFAKIPDDRNIFKDRSSIQLRLLFAVLSLDDKVTPGWERDNIVDGTLSGAGQACEKLRDACRDVSRGTRDACRDFVPIEGHQPQMTFCLDLADAVAAAKKGLISVSSKEFIVATLPEKGMDYVILSASPVANPTPENWQGHIYILGGAKRVSDGISRMEIQYPSQSIYVRMDDNNLLRVEQRGAQLYFSKNSAGYAQASGEFTVMGTGAAADIPLSNIYARINYLEALAYIDGNWQRIYNGIIEQQKSGNRTIDPVLVKSALEPLVSDKSPDSPPSTPQQFVSINYGNLVQVLPPVDPVPVYMRLQDSTLLKIVAHREDVHFYRTAAGYAIAGGKIAIGGVITAGADVPVSNLYTEITANEALGYFDNDWRPMYNAAARQARAIPNTVWPSIVLHTLSPNTPMPSMYGVSFQGATALQIGPQ